MSADTNRPRKMHITYVSFDEVPSFKGASTHVLSGLRRAMGEHQISLISLGDTLLRPEQGFWHWPMSIKEKNYLRRGERFRERVEGMLKRLSPDLVHIRSPWEGIAVAKLGIPFIYEVNGLPSVELRYMFRNVPLSVLERFREWETRLLLAAERIICPSERLCKFLLERYPELPCDKILHYPNAYDPVSLNHRTPIESSAPLRMVYLGTLSHWQGIRWALKALTEFHGRLTLDIYTPASKHLRRRFLRKVSRLGLEGMVQMKEPLHRALLCSRLPEYDLAFAPLLKTERNVSQGAYPLKLLDYLAHQVPIIASDLFVVRQILVEQDEAILFAPNSMQSLKLQLQKAIEDAELRGGVAAMSEKSLARLWTWEDYGTALSNLYASVGRREFALAP